MFDLWAFIQALAAGGGLRELLLALMQGGLAGWIAYRLMETPFGGWMRAKAARWLAPLGATEPKAARWLAVVISTVLSLAAYGVAVWGGVEPRPADAVTVVDRIVKWGALAFMASQTYHTPHAVPGDERG